MLEEMILAHSILVDIFLGFLFCGLAIPFIIKNPVGFKKGSFIYTMVFQALATMVAFAGLVAVYSGHLGWEVTTTLMGVIWAVMMFIEIKKYKLIKVSDLKDEHTFKVLKSAFFKISIIQILLVAIIVVVMVLKAKGVISL